MRIFLRSSLLTQELFGFSLMVIFVQILLFCCLLAASGVCTCPRVYCISRQKAFGSEEFSPCASTCPFQPKPALVSPQKKTVFSFVAFAGVNSVSSSQGWKWHSPSCYWVGEDLLSFDEARKSCEAHEAALVTITNRY